jgi:PBSX family phage terminase large subunit
LIFEPHTEKQERCIFSEKPIVLLACGIQFGKTRVGAIRTKMYMHKYTDPEDSFIITAPTYKIMQQATLPAFLTVMKGYGEYSKGDAIFKMNNGGICYFRTGTDPDSVVGITNVRHIWGDEAGKFSLYFHENLQARASFKECPIVYTTSPYSLNWIYTDYIRKYKKDPSLVPDLELVQARSNENPYFPEKEFQRKKATMDPRRFNMVYGGEFHKLEGLVYDIFEDDRHIVKPRELHPKTIYVAGVDWGYTNPAVISVLGVTPTDGTFLVAEFYKTQQTIGKMVDAALRLKNVFNIERFYCDPSSPANIVEFNKAKLTAIPADNDIRSGIDSVYELMKDDKFHVFENRAPHFVDEVSIYHYPTNEDVTADKDVKEQMPVKQWDHSMDSVRYPIYAIKKSHGLKKRNPVNPKANPIDTRIHLVDDMLKRGVVNDYDW